MNETDSQKFHSFISQFDDILLPTIFIYGYQPRRNFFFENPNNQEDFYYDFFLSFRKNLSNSNLENYKNSQVYQTITKNQISTFLF